jgi:hypothetical protein
VGINFVANYTSITDGVERPMVRRVDLELTGEPEGKDSFVLHGLTKLTMRWTPEGV